MRPKEVGPLPSCSRGKVAVGSQRLPLFFTSATSKSVSMIMSVTDICFCVDFASKSSLGPLAWSIVMRVPDGVVSLFVMSAIVWLPLTNQTDSSV